VMCDEVCNDMRVMCEVCVVCDNEFNVLCVRTLRSAMLHVFVRVRDA
jgi:hypothetical protein